VPQDYTEIDSGNIATQEYLNALWLEALRWPEPAEGEFMPARRKTEARCLSCGELSWRLWNGRRRCYEFACLAPLAECGARWRMKGGEPQRLDVVPATE